MLVACIENTAAHKTIHRNATVRHLRFGPMVPCVVHAFKGLACRAPVLLAHAVVTENIILFNGSKNSVPHGARNTPQRTSHQTVILLPTKQTRLATQAQRHSLVVSSCKHAPVSCIPQHVVRGVMHLGHNQHQRIHRIE